MAFAAPQEKNARSISHVFPISREGAGVVTGGCSPVPANSCDGGGFCSPTTTSATTLSTGFRAAFPFRISARQSFLRATRVPDRRWTYHLPITRSFFLTSPNPLANVFRGIYGTEHRRRQPTAGQTPIFRRHTLEPTRGQVSGEIRYRFLFNMTGMELRVCAIARGKLPR